MYLNDNQYNMWNNGQKSNPINPDSDISDITLFTEIHQDNHKKRRQRKSKHLKYFNTPSLFNSSDEEDYRRLIEFRDKKINSPFHELTHKMKYTFGKHSIFI